MKTNNRKSNCTRPKQRYRRSRTFAGSRSRRLISQFRGADRRRIMRRPDLRLRRATEHRLAQGVQHNAARSEPAPTTGHAKGSRPKLHLLYDRNRESSEFASSGGQNLPRDFIALASRFIYQFGKRRDLDWLRVAIIDHARQIARTGNTQSVADSLRQNSLW